MAPEVGLEPTTLRLTAECSAIELLRIAWRTQATGRLLLNLYNKCARVGQSGVILIIHCEQSLTPRIRIANKASFATASLKHLFLLDHQGLIMTSDLDSGIISIPSQASVDQTVDSLTKTLAAKNITLFALVDHSGEAANVGMTMPPTKLLIFGSPRAGTPVMLAAPSSALDLPLKILVSEDKEGKVWITYNAPSYLQQRHAIPIELLTNIAVIEPLARSAAE